MGGTHDGDPVSDVRVEPQRLGSGHGVLADQVDEQLVDDVATHPQLDLGDTL